MIMEKKNPTTRFRGDQFTSFEKMRRIPLVHANPESSPQKLEAPSGFEPLNRSFADCSLSHLGTAPRPAL